MPGTDKDKVVKEQLAEHRIWRWPWGMGGGGGSCR